MRRIASVTNPNANPEYAQEAFTCPHCGVYARQQWIHWELGGRPSQRTHAIARAECHNCCEYSVWHDKQLIYPHLLAGPVPATDMSDNVREVYEEARTIAAASPRAAAALLRVCVEMVINELVPGDATLFRKIGKLVEQDLDQRIQKMLDSVRFYGNDGGAHPGEIDLKEQPEVVSMLMFCVNRIVEQMNTWPRQADEFYETIPENKRQGIEQRDRPHLQQSPDQN